MLCQEGILSGRNFVRKEFCQEGILSGRNFVRQEFCQAGFVRKEFCQEEFCQEGILSGRNFVSVKTLLALCLNWEAVLRSMFVLLTRFH